MIRQVLLLFLVIVLNFADVATTIYGFRYLGAMDHVEVKERNPLQSWIQEDSILMEKLPIKLLMPLVYAVAFLICYYYCLRIGFIKGLKILRITLVGLFVIYVVVVANNLIQIARVLL